MLCHIFWSQVEYKIVCFISISNVRLPGLNISFSENKLDGVDLNSTANFLMVGTFRG